MKNNNTNEFTFRKSLERIPSAGLSFEETFMSYSLEKQVTHCDHYELVSYFKKWLPQHQPILEAGCGSGRWVAWFKKNGWTASGLDWSEKLCERARQIIPDAHFDVGDMRSMPYRDDEFGAIVSLGAIEHTPEGPMQSLREYYRVLHPGGIAVITVPYLGFIRKFQRFMSQPKKILSHSQVIRKLLGKKVGLRTFTQAKRETLCGYTADYLMTDLGWDFYQYYFSKKQMQKFLLEADFLIVEEFVEFRNEGILHNFGRIAGTYDFEMGIVSLTVIGKILRFLLPAETTGHMLCYIVCKDIPHINIPVKDRNEDITSR